jgi:hypothetical protein
MMIKTDVDSRIRAAVSSGYPAAAKLVSLCALLASWVAPLGGFIICKSEASPMPPLLLVSLLL